MQNNEINKKINKFRYNNFKKLDTIVEKLKATISNQSWRTEYIIIIIKQFR